MGNKTRQDTSFSNKKQEKMEKQGEKHLKKTQEKKNNKYKKDRNEILTKFWEMLKTETSFQQDFGKCWKRKREQKQGLLKCHETTIQEQKQGIGAGLVRSTVLYSTEYSVM